MTRKEALYQAKLKQMELIRSMDDHTIIFSTDDTTINLFDQSQDSIYIGVRFNMGRNAFETFYTRVYPDGSESTKSYFFEYEGDNRHDA